MKFHCESCNARYSIPSERVRGKVLKIRCKGCSAVITVREDEEPGVLEGTGKGNALPVTAVDWYMSIEGEQTGPMKLPLARAWLAKQTTTATIYCWYDGFGDWKPVEQVAAFANSRARAESTRKPSAPVPSPNRALQSNGLGAGAATVVPSLRVPSAAAEGMRPGAGVRTQSARANAPAKALAPAPTIVPTLRPSQPAPSAARAPMPSNAGLGRPLGQTPSQAPSHRDGDIEHGRRGRSQRPTGPTRPLDAPVKRRVPLVAPPSVPPTPLPTPAALSSPRVLSPVSPSPGLSSPGLSLPGMSSPGLSPPGLSSGLSSPGLSSPGLSPSGPSEPEAPYKPRSAASSPNQLVDDTFLSRSDDDLDLDIEEPSRVVNLDMLMGQHRAAGAKHSPVLPGMLSPPTPIAAPATPHRARADSEPAILGSMGATGAMGPMGPMAGFGDELESVAAAPRRRSSMAILLSVVAVLALAAGVLAFVVMGGSSDKSDRAATRGQLPGNFETLGYQLDRPDRRVGQPDDNGATPDTETGDKDKSKSGSSGRSSKRDGSRRSDHSGDGSGSSGNTSDKPGDKTGDKTGDGSGKTEFSNQGTTTEALSPLSPDDVIRQSSRSQIAFKRCYERAKKKDPFLEVRSLNIRVQISAAGTVDNVNLSAMGDSYLGKCLTGAIQRWTLRPSTAGINTEISLEFERM